MELKFDRRVKEKKITRNGNIKTKSSRRNITELEVQTNIFDILYPTFKFP